MTAQPTPRSFAALLLAFATLAAVAVAAHAGAQKEDGPPEICTVFLIARQPPKILVDPAPLDLNEFRLYGNAQAALARSHLVLNAALRDPKVAKLNPVREAADPVAWLE